MSELTVEQMPKVRIFYSKTGRAKYISHLDLTRCMARAFRRAGLPVWSTQGFNPHLYMTYPLPLSLGYEGARECVDIRLTERMPLPEAARRFGEALPEGLTVLEAAPQMMDQSAIAWADYQMEITPRQPGAGLTEKLAGDLSREQILVMKRTKKGEREIDLKNLFRVLGLSGGGDSVHLALRLAAGMEQNINPALLLDNIPCRAEMGGIRCRRAAILTADLTPFR